MGDDPAQGVRRKKDSSLVRAAEAVRDGTASAMVSAGNTGATMASALLRMGRIKGVSRPAIATPIPVPGWAGHPDGPARRRRQRRVPARVARAVRPDGLGLRPPPLRQWSSRRSGCCRSARSRSKGNSLVKETHELLAATPGLNFIGNVEGRDIMTDDVDVVVTDGFTGNVVLKTLEGGREGHRPGLRRRLRLLGAVPPATDVLPPVLDPLYETLDPETYGGAMLLGVDGVCIISHGSSQRPGHRERHRLAQEMVDAASSASLRVGDHAWPERPRCPGRRTGRPGGR